MALIPDSGGKGAGHPLNEKITLKPYHRRRVVMWSQELEQKLYDPFISDLPETVKAQAALK